MKNGDKCPGIFTPVFKGNYPYCLQEITGKSIEWKYMGESTIPPVGAELFMALTDNAALRDCRYWVYADAIDFDNRAYRPTHSFLQPLHSIDETLADNIY